MIRSKSEIQNFPVVDAFMLEKVLNNKVSIREAFRTYYLSKTKLRELS